MIVKLKKFSAINLSKEIEVVVFGEHEGISKNKSEAIQLDVNKHIISRLVNFGEDLYYYFEPEYIETEWKDMISVHYINTSYMTKGTVMRVHLFSTDYVSNENYLGFFSLRTIDDIDMMLSYIYPNWENITFDTDQSCYLMTYHKVIHLCGIELNIYTYPLFAQDTAVTSCSQASIISMSNYLKGKYNYPHIRILDINNCYTYGRKKMFPTLGLDPFQMLEIFDANGIPVDYQLCENKKIEEVRAHIDYCVESALPVMLGVHISGGSQDSEHVLQIIGHTYGDDKKQYIIYDDSGYYIGIKEDGAKSKGSSFTTIISWDKLKELLVESETHECGFIMYPLHEKIYILYNHMAKYHFRSCERMLYSSVKGAIIKAKRILIVDNNIVKEFLARTYLDDDNMEEANEEVRRYHERIVEQVNLIVPRNLPHYLWVLEVERDNGNKFLFFADPTFNPSTRKNIFINFIPIPTMESFSLLKCLNKK